MEAPEKVYLLKIPISGELDEKWLSDKSCSDDIEYIRSDVFIEKACDYLRNHIDKDLTIYHEQTWCKRDEFIKKFCKYMKGE